ncbi:ABC transporter permease [Streptomyces odontomachi]|uniref:ABC transporter permease n=1 Tax=Streptomyces odontomachi TaxID=2944940 RepID=UPI00210926D2|nr:FtsX-like permease family protein [Streptomyces sp. ODS25]
MSATPAPRGTAPRRWLRDLAMGARFSVTGGRESRARALLTAVGVGLGVALLLLTASWPYALQHRHERERARNDMTSSSTVHAKAADTLLVATTDTTYDDTDVRGRLLEPEGPKAPRPPGVAELPAPGEMVVSPALLKLLESDDDALLRDRLPYRVSGTIADSGLVGPGELAYYAGATGLHAGDEVGRVLRIDSFGSKDPREPLDPVLLLLVVIVFVVLLMPVGVFIAAAVRFGGERRDRRLAALRLIGADGRATRRIAAGEALAGALLGLVFGAGFFTAGRQLARRITLADVSVFPADLSPAPGLLALIVCAVPAAAVAVTLLALRHVVIEPLGVVRSARPARRRLWWRLLVPPVGLALLYPMLDKGRNHGNFNEWLVIGGTVLLLIGVTTLLPWVVEAVVARLHAGPLSWQLAVRRLQLSSGTAARMVNGIAVAVAGAIALQMLFAGVQGDYTRQTDADLSRAQMTVDVPHGDSLAATDRVLRATHGVRHTIPVSQGAMGEKKHDPDAYVPLMVGTCTALQEMARLPGCHEGDAFLVPQAEDRGVLLAETAKPGRTLYVDPSYGNSPGRQVPWRLPALKAGTGRADPTGISRAGIFVTPSALPQRAAAAATGRVFVRLDPAVPDARDRVRTATARVDPLMQVFELAATVRAATFASIRTGLFLGATLVLVLIGASLLVSQLEQLRERKKLLSALVAFGTRRRTLSLSVLWQTAIPVVLGLLLASAAGLALGVVLLKMIQASVSVDWSGVASLTGMGALVVLMVTLLSMPALLRMMRADGLRTE